MYISLSLKPNSQVDPLAQNHLARHILAARAAGQAIFPPAPAQAAAQPLFNIPVPNVPPVARNVAAPPPVAPAPDVYVVFAFETLPIASSFVHLLSHLFSRCFC
jgi:hypothetical protein